MAKPRRQRQQRGRPHLTRQRGKKKHWYGYIPTEGREIALGTPDAAEAQCKLLDLARERERAQGLRKATQEQEAIAPSLARLSAEFIQHIQPPRKTKKTAESYAQRVVAFVAWTEKQAVLRADQVDFLLLHRFVEERSKEVSAATVNRDLTPIRSMFGYARRLRQVKRNPFADPDAKELSLREAQAHRKETTLSPNDVAVVLEKAKAHLRPGHAALVKLVAGSGLRIDEARHLEREDVEVLDDKRGFLHISSKPHWHPKSYRERRVPVSKATCDAALEFVDLRSSVRLDNKATWNALKVLAEKSHLPRFSMHAFRRAWASALYANGAPLKLVSALLGHSGVAVTERYLRVFHDHADKAHQYLAL